MRLVRAVDDSDPAETVMVLGGELGVVTLHLSLCGTPEAMVVHSARELPGWIPASRCERMEVQCWCMAEHRSPSLEILRRAATGEDEFSWQVMESAYYVYLGGPR